MGRKRGHRHKGSGQTKLKEFESDIFRCKISPIFGRYLETKVDVKKGDMLHKEKCLVAGPKISSTIVCVGCHSDMLKTKTRMKCSNCKWPLCTVQCANSPFHKMECKFLLEKNIQPPSEPFSTDYGALTILRALLLKLYQPEDWQLFASLEHHNSIRSTLPSWKESDESIVSLIRNKWNLKDLFSEDEIFSAIGIFEVNGFEMGDYQSFGGIFPIAAMIAHECVPNATQFENIDESRLEVRAVVDIPAGSPITLCYDCILKGTSLRKRQIKKSKYFECTCNRCIDPTELGTHLSTVVCTECRKPTLLNKISENIWVCNKCSTKVSNDEIENVVNKYTTIAESLSSIKAKEEFLAECKTVFHPTHYIPLGIKFSLCMAYGRDDGYSLAGLSPAEVHRKLALCSEILKVLDVLTPGVSVIRGNILYEIQAAEVLVAKNMMETGKCSKALVRRRLQNSLKILHEAIEIFDLSYPTRMLAQSAKETTLLELKGWIASLK